MYFARALVAFVVLGASAVFASPTPVVEKRGEPSDVVAVVGSLRVSTDSILPKLDALVNANLATEANINPLLKQLVEVLETTTTTLEAFNGEVEVASTGVDLVANEIATVYTNIATSLDNLKAKKPLLYLLVPKFGLDNVLMNLLLALKPLVAGVLKVIAKLLKPVGGLLSALGLPLLSILLALLF